jgi:hypothetical protein
MKETKNQLITRESEGGLFRRHVSKLKPLVLVAGVGSLLGTQIYDPNKRVIEAIAGAILLTTFWRFSTIASLWILLVFYPFPFAMSWGTSNFIFIFLIVAIMLLRMASGHLKFKLDKTVFIPVIMMMASYLFSFMNVPVGKLVTKIAYANTLNFLAAAAFMFLLINFIDDEEKLRKTMRMLMVTASLVILFTIFELLVPGKVLVPNWLYTTHKFQLVMKGLRVEGPFHDYELNAEFFTLNAFLIFFMFIRAKRMVTRFLFGSLLMVDLMLMFAAITRGAFFSLIVGIVYLMFLSRKDLNIVKVAFIAGGLICTIMVLEAFVSQYTTSGSLFERVIQTSFRSGVIPNNRYNIWNAAIERGMRHPIFGNGPGWDFASRYDTGFWPHNLYLFYFNITGVFGLAAFLFLMYKIVRLTFSGIKASIVTSPFPEALMKILHVIIVIFLFDQIKIEYLRNRIYTFFVWSLFALIVITYNVIKKNRENQQSAVPS